MSHTVTRRTLLTLLLATAAAGPAIANPPKASLRPILRGGDIPEAVIAAPEALIDKAKLGQGRVAYAVADAKSGLLLETRNPAVGTPPASVAKALTALYALDVLGPDYRFETRLMATGATKNGIVQGDLVLAGGGDPTLDTNTLARLAADLKARGVHGVKGDFIVYDGALPRLDQINSDQPEHVSYNPAVSGIALNYNRVHFEWRREAKGYAVTMDARSDKYRPDVAMAHMRIETRRMPVYTYADKGGRDDWTVASGALGKSGARWLPVRKPALYAADVFATMAASHGIELRKPKVADVLPRATVLVTYQSEPLREILRDMLRYSTNLTAEMVGMTASSRRLGRVGSLTASAQEMNGWAQQALGLRAPKLVDHSGLGAASALRADDMVKALVQSHKNDVLRPILKQISLRDEKGRPRKDHPIRVDAKTGTLNFVSGLAGYMTAKDGTVLAFAIFAADEKERAGIPRAERERPRGAQSWNTRAKRLQQALIERWGAIYGT